MVQSSAETLLSLIDDILDFSKIEAGKFELAPISFSLRDTLSDSLKLLAVRAHTKGLELACRIPSDVPDQVRGDAGRLRQCLLNLVGNAIKFTDRGEVEVQVAVEARADTRVCLRFSVRDTGIGIPAEKCDKIFAPFEQVDASTTRRFGGTGLGLAIVTELVKLMGGRVWVESELGLGSTFHFSAWMDEDVPAVVSAHCLPLDSRSLHGLPILIVDDNSTSRAILSELLRGWNMRPETATNAEEAIAELERAAILKMPYPIVLIDAFMPGEDGYSLFRRIRQNSELQKLRVVLLASADQSSRRESGSMSEMPIAIAKPVKPSELFEAILFSFGIQAQAGPAELPVEREKVRTRALRILVAEDNPINQMVTAERLKQAGHSVLVVENGKQAIDAVRQELFDAAFLDVHMPEMDGFTALAAIRKIERGTGRHLPIIALTANAMKGDRERCLQAGFDDYVPKPIRFDDLFAVLDRLVPAQAGKIGPPPSLAPIFDRSKMVDQFDGDEALGRKMAEMFLRNCPRWLGDIRRAIEVDDAKKLHMTAHSLKGAVGHFTDAGPFQNAFLLEKIGKKGDLGLAGGALSQLEEDMDRLQESLREMLETNEVIAVG